MKSARLHAAMDPLSVELHRQLIEHDFWVSTGGSRGARADLDGVNLDNADLRNLNLSGAQLRGVSFRGAQFNGSMLILANLTNSDFEMASLRGCNLSGATLWGCNLRRADLTDAIISNVSWTSEDGLGTICPDGTNSVDNEDESCENHLSY